MDRSTPGILTRNPEKEEKLSTEIGSNPLAVVRGWPIKNIPLDKIDLQDDVVPDDIFMSKYIDHMTGKLTAYATRVPIDKVMPGFWRPNKNTGGFDYVCDPLAPESVAVMSDLIRRGDRQPIFIYRNPNKLDAHSYVCPDDVNVISAYQNLGIKSVPAILLDRPDEMEESGIGIKTIRGPKNIPISYTSCIAGVTHKTAPSYLGENRQMEADSINRIIYHVDLAREKIRKFHRDGEISMHYHHTLHSVLLRTKESLLSVKLLFENKLYVNAISIVRSLYELALTFYVDWLAPTHMYQYLQIAAVEGQKKWEERCRKMYTNYVGKSGFTDYDAKTLSDGHIRAYRLASVVSEKAKIFPFGPEYHKDMYAFLSDIAHHDFSMVARYTYTLDHGDESVFMEDIIKSVAHYVDLFSAAIVTRIMNDVGDVTDVPQESDNQKIWRD
ncbi:hypothetical protein [Burkholderia ubonensis]|uniref:hypothetical protein n=1 Tax=Burkholderia ubonensis TaxID=101571 RepID=UPI0012F867A1|nr:hypothetical protein [Burkholderia ubonensis]